MDDRFKAVPHGVTFIYKMMSGDEVQTIRCLPLGFAAEDGEQIMRAYDLDRESYRTFYLRNIIAFPVVYS